mgnify:CR=1 FL=1
MMAEAYAKAKNSIGAVCVTAGPGATNALPGLAEAYVDSAPIIIISFLGDLTVSVLKNFSMILKLGNVMSLPMSLSKTITKEATSVRGATWNAAIDRPFRWSAALANASTKGNNGSSLTDGPSFVIAGAS